MRYVRKGSGRKFDNFIIKHFIGIFLNCFTCISKMF